MFKFCAFGDKYSQPNSVSASKGPTKGTMHAQLVLKAVFMLEKAGTLVDTAMCDAHGAATNHYVWKEFWVSVNLNFTNSSFMHPADDKRGIFFLPDICIL